MKKILLLSVVFIAVHTKYVSAKIWTASDKVAAVSECTYGQVAVEVVTTNCDKQVAKIFSNSAKTKEGFDSKFIVKANSSKGGKYFLTSLPRALTPNVVLINTSLFLFCVLSTFRRVSF
jgi:hypothetical protein